LVETIREPEAQPSRPLLTQRPEFVYSLGLFLSAILALGFAAGRAGSLLPDPPALAAFFLLFGLVTILMGYEHPRVGYVSFDRLAQVSSILVLGPVHAALINGVASLAFPFWRLRDGRPLERVVTAALNNAGLMTWLILVCGSLYAALGGTVPLTRLDGVSVLLLPLLIVGMQAVNELGLGLHLRLRDGRWPGRLSHFVLGMEAGSGMAGVLVAVIVTRMEGPVVALLLLVLFSGTLTLRQFARMRTRLEAIVDERTQVLREKTLELERLAISDQLTGLFNRRFADDYLERRIEDFNRYGRAFTIALVDLDHFKRINDQYSHGVGDEVLRRVARIFLDRCRGTDTVARFGGEEFLLCFPETSANVAVDVCEVLRTAVATLDWSDLAPDLQVSLSAGVAEMRPGYNRSRLLNAADYVLYQAKDAGRNQVLV
jgi:diguanylate cyclase (GGDEF)-like protein